MYKIYLIEDDHTIASRIKEHLEGWGYLVKTTEDFRDAVDEFAAFDPHMVLIDLMLPFFNGYHWCAEIRKISEVPVVFLSSAADNMNIVMAMNMGGDDFIPKPVDLNVLTAKIGALLRRTYDMGSKIPVLEHRGAVLNLNDASLTYRGERLELTKNEFRVLQTLMENRGKIVSRDTLMTRLWQIDCYVEENTLSVNVARLRKKLEAVGLGDLIKTKVGAGYLVE
ncbi:MAG: response regulator transcription factor [Bacteroides sp.]|nr:response regulator transcription factor [Eubacterium sp.]MCM1418636.1 response regulator transcription factor [Roseburia sp.]MCM1462690.1 response regulator transcription factor [Bacteroides sp.]